MTDTKGGKQVREPVQVYLDPADLTLLDELVQATGLTKAELLRRGLRRLSTDALGDKAPGWSLDRLIGVVDDPDAPVDLSSAHDRHLYGKPKRGRSRLR